MFVWEHTPVLPSASQRTSGVEWSYNLQRFLNCQQFLEQRSEESYRDYFGPVGEQDSALLVSSSQHLSQCWTLTYRILSEIVSNIRHRGNSSIPGKGVIYTLW